MPLLAAGKSRSEGARPADALRDEFNQKVGRIRKDMWRRSAAMPGDDAGTSKRPSCLDDPDIAAAFWIDVRDFHQARGITRPVRRLPGWHPCLEAGRLDGSIDVTNAG